MARGICLRTIPAREESGAKVFSAVKQMHRDVGIPEGTPEPIGTAFPAKLIFKGATIASVAVGTRRDAIEVMDFAARGEALLDIQTGE
ncbi:MAG: hypothetical protein Q9173_000827 [Seirophora scorigena]